MSCATRYVEGVGMSYQKDSYSKQQVHRIVNPQGLSEDIKDQRPKSKLEERAKKKNTKI